MFRRVLIPLDGSNFAEHIVTTLTPLISPQTDVILLRVAESSPHFSVAPEAAVIYDLAFTTDHEEAAAYLARLQGCFEQHGYRARPIVAEGEVAEAICQVAEEEGADLIAMATHGRGGLSRWVLGSVADRVVQRATVPVLLARPREDEEVEGRPLRRIVVPLDGSELAQHALPHARQLAQDHGASLILVQAVEPPLTIEYDVLPLDGSFHDRQSIQQSAAESYLERVAQLLRATGIPAEPLVLHDAPQEAICYAATQANVDLIVMTTHGRGGLTRALLGSVADHVLRHTSCPLLLVREETVRVEVPDTVRPEKRVTVRHAPADAGS